MHGLPKHGLFELDRICICLKLEVREWAENLLMIVNDASRWYDKQGEKIRKLYLLTHEDNKNAHSFYEKVGFSHETTLKIIIIEIKMSVYMSFLLM